MKAVGVFAVNDTRARLGSPALLTKLRSSPLVLQVACCYFLAGGFLFACARGFCARWRVFAYSFDLLRTWSRSSFSSHISSCSGAILLVAPFLWFLPSACLPAGEVRSKKEQGTSRSWLSLLKQKQGGPTFLCVELLLKQAAGLSAAAAASLFQASSWSPTHCFCLS